MEFALLLTMEMHWALKKSQVESQKTKIVRENILQLFPEKKNKKICKTYKRVLTTFITLQKFYEKKNKVRNYA